MRGAGMSPARCGNIRAGGERLTISRTIVSRHGRAAASCPLAMTALRCAALLPLLALRLGAAAAPQTAPVDTGDANAQQSLVKLEPPEQIAQRLASWSE